MTGLRVGLDLDIDGWQTILRYRLYCLHVVHCERRIPDKQVVKECYGSHSIYLLVFSCPCPRHELRFAKPRPHCILGGVAIYNHRFLDMAHAVDWLLLAFKVLVTELIYINM